MNKSESKYFNTARIIDQALIELLAMKEIEYITVKENNSGYSTRTLHSAIITSAENGVIKAYDTYAKKTYEIRYTKEDNDYSLSGKYYNSNEIVTNLCSVFPPKYGSIKPKE